MGSSDSKEQEEKAQQVKIPTDPLITQLRNTLRLKAEKKQSNHTYSFIHTLFSQQINKANADQIVPTFSPFCSIFIRQSKGKFEQITCSLISPIMVIAPSRYICDSSGFIIHNNLIIEGWLKTGKIVRKAKKTIVFKDKMFVVILLDEPIWQLGWCGVIYINQYSKINELPLHMIKNSQEESVEKGAKAKQGQKIARVFSSSDTQYRGKSIKSDYGLLFQIIERKPYIIGIQIDRSVFFCDYYTLKELQQILTDNVSVEDEKEYLKKIDIQQIQIMTSW